MGPIFDYGYGPFRWVCLSGRPEDLAQTDQAALACIDPTGAPKTATTTSGSGTRSKTGWWWAARRGFSTRTPGRVRIALAFNRMVRERRVGPIMLGRDHHDPGGTDSPFRETANIRDGSNVTADMATHCFAGNAARGMSLVALHNGGGTGIGKASTAASGWCWTAARGWTQSSARP
jgi:urocanate hydratase